MKLHVAEKTVYQPISDSSPECKSVPRQQNTKAFIKTPNTHSKNVRCLFQHAINLIDSQISFKKQIIGGDPHLEIPYRCVGFTGTMFLFVLTCLFFMKKEECLFMLMRIKAGAKSMDQIRRSGQSVVFSCDGKLFLALK